MKIFLKCVIFFICTTLLIACANQRAVLWHGINATPSMIVTQREIEGGLISPKAIVPVYVATSRRAQDNYSQPYGAERSNRVYYNRVDVGIPQQHMKGIVEKNAYKPSLDKYFTAVALQQYDNKERFKQQLNLALAKKPKGKKKFFFLFMVIIIILRMAHSAQLNFLMIIL